jgi:hypothetical protein
MERLTPDQRQEAGRRVLECLQIAFYADPAGMMSLVENRVPMNAALTEHPHMLLPGDPFPVDLSHVPGAGTSRHLIGLLGILNMVLSPLQLPKIATLYVDRIVRPEGAEPFDGNPDNLEPEDVEVICAGFGCFVDPESEHAAKISEIAEGIAAETDVNEPVEVIGSPEMPIGDPWTEEQKEDAFKRILGLLQSCWEADPGATYTLIANKVTTNQQIVEHPFIICEPVPVAGQAEELPMFGVLGVINGVMGCLGLPLIATRWENNDPSDYHPQRMCGFQRFAPSPQPDPADN